MLISIQTNPNKPVTPQKQSKETFCKNAEKILSADNNTKISHSIFSSVSQGFYSVFA
jgi:hypothetical protein